MTNSEKLLVGGLAVAGGLAYALMGKEAKTEAPAQKQLPGRRKGRRGRLGTGSYWAQMGTNRSGDDIETLARVIISEAGSQSIAEWQAIAWVARNKSTVRRTPLVQFLGNPYGKQGGRMANGKRRTFSTRQKATTASRSLARQVLDADQSLDPTKGATSAFEPRLQDKLFANKRYRRDAAMLRREWRGGGGNRIGTIGRWELWAQRTRTS